MDQAKLKAADPIVVGPPNPEQWSWLARSVIATAAGEKREQKGLRRPTLLVGGVAAVLLVSGGAYAGRSALHNGYVGVDTLVATESWEDEWRSALGAYDWPSGTDYESFIAIRVNAGAERPDAVPLTDLTYDAFALNMCTWTAAAQHRAASGDAEGVREAGSQIDKQLAASVNSDIANSPIADVAGTVVIHLRTGDADAAGLAASDTCSPEFVGTTAADVR